MKISNLFDKYNLYARLYPTLLLLLPLLISALVLDPELITSNVSVTLTSLAVSCGLLYLFSSLCRSAGKRLEKSLLSDWGAWPTTQWLRHRDTYLSAPTKARYHLFLSKNVPGITSMPTATEEEGDPERADEIYHSAIEWLKEQRRDAEKFSLVLEENIQYGFRRNLVGVKSLGIIFCFLATCVLLTGSVLQYTSQSNMQISNDFFANLLVITKSIPSYVIGAAIFDIFTALAWTLLLNRNWVREAADQYARALLASCDT